MLTFESMSSLDPTMGGFSVGAGAGTASGNQGGGASGQFAAQLSGVMSGGATSASDAGSAGQPASAGTSGMSGGSFDVLGVIQADIDLGADTTVAVAASPTGELAQAVVQALAATPDDGEAVADGDGTDTGDGAVDEGTAALKAGLAFVPQVDAVTGADAATVNAGAQTNTASDGTMPVQDAPTSGAPAAGQASSGDAGLDLPTFFPQVAGASASGDQAAGDAAMNAQSSGTSPAQGGAPAQVPAAANASGAAAMAGGIEAKAGSTADAVANTLKDSETAVAADGAGKDAKSAGSPADKANVDKSSAAGAPAQTASDKALARSPAVTLPSGSPAGGETAAAGKSDNAATDSAVLSVKAMRNGPTATVSTAPVADGDENVPVVVAKTNSKASALNMDGANSADPTDADKGADPAKPQATPQRTPDQVSAQSAGLKAAAGAGQPVDDGDPRLNNLSSVSDVGDDGDAEIQKVEPQGANKSTAHERTRGVTGASAVLAGAAATSADKAVDGAKSDTLDPLVLGTSVDGSAANVRGADGQAVRAAQSGQGTATALPTAMVATEIARNAQRGVTRFEIRLDPPELGRVDVHLKINDDGKVQAHLVVERRDTLDMFMRDQRGMERALENAGLKANSDGGLQFSLKDQGQGQGFAGGDGNQNGNGTPTGPLAGGPAASEAADQQQMLDRIAAYSRHGAGGVDIRI
ncbi:flagellar hook-length control protein FliK [Breoghania corrubedonensis]|uniref:Flagellar hook-length control protein FliK n=1 Tax=Breoghania corrubedonensis TaxID=665038 RepID=A0A2T5UTZ8_9HYPH|nr:flagellar hook-length control protein FliK [Breoghania corrubedonensis]PTW54999.1 flagellar hook-length control protein FliK [Breoghania corrubedonensis]